MQTREWMVSTPFLLEFPVSQSYYQSVGKIGFPVSLLRKSKTLVGLKRDCKAILIFPHLIKRKRIIRDYFNTHNIKKLHLGSNITVLDGWLCSDIQPQNNASIYLDVAKKFPLDDGTFDYVYSEHLIEHLSMDEGMFMLQECYRVLKKNGKIRIATPDLEVLADLYSRRKENYRNDYIKWSVDNFAQKSFGYSPVIVLNTLFHNWQHQFLYDFEFLKKTLSDIGFVNIRKVHYGESEDSNLQNIEHHHFNVGSLDMIQFETLVMEARK